MPGFSKSRAFVCAERRPIPPHGRLFCLVWFNATTNDQDCALNSYCELSGTLQLGGATLWFGLRQQPGRECRGLGGRAELFRDKFLCPRS